LKNVSDEFRVTLGSDTDASHTPGDICSFQLGRGNRRLTNVAPKGEQNIAGCDFGPSVLSSDFWRSPLQRIYIDCAADIPALNKRHAAGAFGAGLHDPV